MKLIILRNNLKDGLQAVERAVSDNNNLPILKYVLIKAGMRLSISATNLEIGVTFETNAKINEEGVIAIPLGPLSSIINNSTSERINLESKGNTLIVKTDNYEAKIQGLSSEEFPIIPKIENDDKPLEIEGETLKRALNEVSHAAQTNDAKPELSSVLFDFQAGTLKLAATDGFRLAEKTLLNNSFISGFNKPVKVLVPIKTVSEVLRIFKPGQKISVYIDPNQVSFKAEGAEIISRLIDGTYPDYTAIIPKQVATEIAVSREEFMTGVKLVSNFSGRGSDIKLRLKEDGSALEIFAANSLVGENNYLIPARKKKGNGFAETAFNWKYLLEGVRPLSSEMITIGLVSETKPAIIRPAEDDSLMYIVMPISA